jgi:hypothetical protein
VVVSALACGPRQAAAEADEPRHLTWNADTDRAGKGDEAARTRPRPVHAEERPFGYLVDPTTPSARDVTAEYRLGLASGVEAARPLPATMAASGAEHAFTLGYGVTDRIAPFASFLVLQPSDGGNASVTGNAGGRFQITRPGAPFRFTLAPVFFREFGGTFGASARASASYDVGGLRVAGNLLAERAFDSIRDGVDVLVFAGASYRVVAPLRVGVEYVGQDLEEAFENEGAEGGARNFLGPDLALSFLDNRFQLIASAAVGLDQRSPPVMGRCTVLTVF